MILRRSIVLLAIVAPPAVLPGTTVAIPKPELLATAVVLLLLALGNARSLSHRSTQSADHNTLCEPIGYTHFAVDDLQAFFEDARELFFFARKLGQESMLVCYAHRSGLLR